MLKNARGGHRDEFPQRYWEIPLRYPPRKEKVPSTLLGSTTLGSASLTHRGA
jgi:hypothetical protein